MNAQWSDFFFWRIQDSDESEPEPFLTTPAAVISAPAEPAAPKTMEKEEKEEEEEILADSENKKVWTISFLALT